MKKYSFIPTLLAAAVSSSVMSVSANEGMLALEEIVVTAQKREQSLQDVPIAVQALGADILEQNTITSISDLGNLAPGLSIGNSMQEGSEIAIRGIGTAVLGLGFDQSVPLYLDGVYLGRGVDIIGDLMDVQQVEILKGPQGTLFGRNAAAGAVNITTAAPDEEFGGTIRAGVGKKDLRKVQATLNAPLADNLFMRTNVATRTRDGWQKDLQGGDPLYEQDRKSARVKFLWLPSDELTVELTADYSKSEDTQGGFILDKASAGIPTNDLDAKAVNSNSFLADGSYVSPIIERENKGFAAKVAWDINEELSLTSITSYRTSDMDMISPTAAVTPDSVTVVTPGPTVVIPFDSANVLIDKFDIETDEYSQEFRLNGQTDAVDWFVGVSYFKSEGEKTEDLALPALVALGIPGVQGAFGDNGQGSKVDTEGWAVFGDAIWHVTDKLNVTAGLRYSYDEKEVSYFAIPSRTNTFYAAVPDDFLNGVTKGDADWDDVSGRLVVDYQLDENTMIFAGITQGYKSGGYGTTTGVQSAGDGSAFKPFDKETTTSIETGFKSSLMDNRLRLNMSAFYTQFEDYQLQIAALDEPGTTLDLSAPEAISHGIDLEMSFAATESMTLGLSSGYLETEYSKDVKADDGTVAIPEGQDLLRAPRWTTTASLDYVFPLANAGQIRFNTTYTYRTTQRLSNSPANTLTSAIGNIVGDPGVTISESDLESGSYGLLNARLSYLSEDEKWEVAVWGTNLTDTAYRDDDSAAVANGLLGAIGGEIADAFGPFTPAEAAMAVVPYTRNEPRMWGVDFTYNF